jgi:hypothetical protein
MAKSKGKPEGTGRPHGSTRQVNFRATDAFVAELESISDALGLDVSALVRMVLKENLGPYRKRAEQARRGDAP